MEIWAKPRNPTPKTSLGIVFGNRLWESRWYKWYKNVYGLKILDSIPVAIDCTYILITHTYMHMHVHTRTCIYHLRRCLSCYLRSCHTHTLSHTHTNTHTHTHTLSLSLSLSLSLTHTHTHTHTHFLSLSLSLSLTHTHTLDEQAIETHERKIQLLEKHKLPAPGEHGAAAGEDRLGTGETTWTRVFFFGRVRRPVFVTLFLF
jgi:hypothetical protein